MPSGNLSRSTSNASSAAATVSSSITKLSSNVSTVAAADTTDDLLNQVMTMKSLKYSLIVLFFVMAIIFGYFIVRIILSFIGVYTKYNSMTQDLEKKKNAFAIPGADDDDNDNSDPRDDAYQDVQYNETIVKSIKVHDSNIQNGSLQELISKRKSSKNGADYKLGANMNANVLSSEFDDYVYKSPGAKEPSFWEYLFHPQSH